MRPLRCLLILLIVLLPAGPFATTFPVTKTEDTDDGVCDPDCSLREAIDAANTNPGADDVPVPAGTYLLTLGQLVVSDDVSIGGAGQTITIIDGNGTDRVFDIEATNGVVEISDVTIQNGYAYLSGGGIRNRGGKLSLTNSTVSDNTAFFGAGGGISTFYGTSQASPLAAACAALLLENNSALTPAQIEAALEASPTSVTAAPAGKVSCFEPSRMPPSGSISETVDLRIKRSAACADPRHPNRIATAIMAGARFLTKECPPVSRRNICIFVYQKDGTCGGRDALGDDAGIGLFAYRDVDAVPIGRQRRRAIGRDSRRIKVVEAA